MGQTDLVSLGAGPYGHSGVYARRFPKSQAHLCNQLHSYQQIGLGSGPKRCSVFDLRGIASVRGFRILILLLFLRFGCRSMDIVLAGIACVTRDMTAQRITVGNGAFFDGGIHIGKPGQQKDRSVRAEISSNECERVLSLFPRSQRTFNLIATP